MAFMYYGNGPMVEKKGAAMVYEAEEEPLKVFSVRLNAIQVRKAMKLGKGNMSAGIRLALANVVPTKEQLA